MTTSTILLIEDDPAVQHLLQATMEFGGFDSERAASALEALERLAERQIAAVLLDLGLPDTEGNDLIREIRRRYEVPILVVSGRDDERTRVDALDAGADDFVCKPFLPAELLARIRAVMRRWDPTELGIDLSPSPFEAAGPRRRIRPSPMEQKLLSYFRKREDKIVTSPEIISHVWGKSAGRTDRNVRVLVALLRRKLKAQGAPFEIINEHARGYRLTRARRRRG